MSNKINNMIIPAYLNQRIVFDFIAMLQDGLSTVTRITSVDSTADEDRKLYGASFGLTQALSSLLKIDISGKRTLNKEKTVEVQRNEERVHTPVSIFKKLREILITNQEVFSLDDNYLPKPGHIVEFTADLRKNPLIQTMDAFVGLLDMAIIFSNEPKKKSGHNPKPEEHKTTKRQMEKFLESLKTGDTTDIVSDTLANKYRAVITLEHEFLNDPTMSDLVDGHFKVLGKIIRVITDNSCSINLIRKTALSAMPKKILDNMFSALSNLQTEEGFDIPPLKLEIEGPVIHVIPIAIFS